MRELEWLRAVVDRGVSPERLDSPRARRVLGEVRQAPDGNADRGWLPAALRRAGDQVSRREGRHE